MGGALASTAHHHHNEEERIHSPEIDGIQTEHGLSGQFRVALELAAAGLPLVRLSPGTNRPNQTNWPNRATTDTHALAALNSEQPDANWGVLTGNGVGVLDVDTKADPFGFGGYSSLIDVQELLDLDLSDLPHVQTASGSHLYFRYSGRLESRVPWVPHLDVKADGGHQVAAPGTVRVVDGQEVTYRLVHGDLSDIPEAPEALLAAIRGWRSRSTTATSSGALRVAGELPTTYAAVTSGLNPSDRNNTMHALACRWWSEYGVTSDTEVFGLARKTWEVTPQVPPFSWAEVESTVESARRFIISRQKADAEFIAAWGRSRRGRR
jgi:hypothetical protein